MLNTIDLEKAVKIALAKTLSLSDTASIAMHHNLRSDLQLDSMSSLMFLMKLEENIEGFLVDPDTLEMRHLETVSSVVNYVNQQMVSKDAHVH